MTNDEWIIGSTIGLAVASSRMLTEQPQTMHISIEAETSNMLNFKLPSPSPTLKSLCLIVQQKFTGTLYLHLCDSYLNYEDCSEIIKTLACSR